MSVEQNHGPATPEPSPRGEYLTTAQGARLRTTDHALKAGPRGPVLLLDACEDPRVTRLTAEVFRHCKGLGATPAATSALAAAGVPEGAPGVVVGEPGAVVARFAELLATHRVWERQKTGLPPVTPTTVPET